MKNAKKLNKRGVINYNLSLKEFARKNRNNPTAPEKKMWYEILRNEIIGYKFLRQKPIDHFIVDFYCSKLLLAIEIDGDSHYEEEEYDKRRNAVLNNLGIQIIRYTNEEVMKNKEGVQIDLIEKIEKRKKELKECLTLLTP